jgi:hypothetical protein
LHAPFEEVLKFISNIWLSHRTSTEFMRINVSVTVRNINIKPVEVFLVLACAKTITDKMFPVSPMLNNIGGYIVSILSIISNFKSSDIIAKKQNKIVNIKQQIITT